MMTRQIIDELLNKAITRPVGKMSNAEVDKYLRRKDRENDSIEAPASVPKMSSEEGKVRSLDEKRAIKLERQGKSSIDDLLKEVSVKRQGYTSIDKRHHADDETDYEESAQHHLSDKQKQQSYGRTGAIKTNEIKKEKEKAKHRSSTTAPKSGHTEEGKRIISDYKAGQAKKVREGSKKKAEREANPPVNATNTWFGLSVDEDGNDLVKSIDALMEKAKLTVEQDRTGHGTDTESQFKDDAGDAGPVKTYRNRPKTGDVEVFEQRTPWPSSDKKKNRKVIPANAAHEKELKNASMTTIIDELLEKAVYGVGTRGGKIEPPGTGKNPKNHGKVSRPTLSKEQQEKILRTSQEKASRGLATAGQHKEAERVRGQKNTVKSLDERTADLVKSLNVDYGKRKSGHKRGGSTQDPDAGIDRKKEERMDADEKKSQVGTKNPAIKDGGRQWTAEDKTQKSQDSDLEKGFRSRYDDSDAGSHAADVEEHRRKTEPSRASKYAESNASDSDTDESLDAGFEKHAPSNKSLDERTSDLHKGFSAEKVGGAIGRAYVSGDPKKQEQSKRVAEKWPGKDKTPGAQDRYNEALTNEVWQHNLKGTVKSMREVAAMWQSGSPYISKGARVVVQGGEPATLVKDEKAEIRRPGGRTPTYSQTDKAQEKVETGQYERERKAKKRIADLGAE